MITWYKGDRIVSAGSLKILNEPRFSVLTSPRDGSVTLAIRKVNKEQNINKQQTTWGTLMAPISNCFSSLALQVRMGDEDDYVCEVNLKDAPISITHHLEVLGEYFDGLKMLGGQMPH